MFSLYLKSLILRLNKLQSVLFTLLKEIKDWVKGSGEKKNINDVEGRVTVNECLALKLVQAYQGKRRPP